MNGDSLAVIDVSSSTNPVKVGGVGAPSAVNAGEVSGQYLYIAGFGDFGGGSADECAVQEALVEGELAPFRFDSYLKILESLAESE